MMDIKRIEEFFENAISNIYSVDNAYSCTSADRDATDAEIKEAETVRDAVLAALAEEPEWEYGTRHSVTDGWERGDRYGEHEYIDDRSISDNINEDRSTTLPRRDMTRAVRHRKAGPWVPVEN